MRIISDEYLDISAGDNLEPVFVAKLISSVGNVYFTSREVEIIDAGSVQFQGAITDASFNSQSIKPELGISSIGGMTFSIDDHDRVFTGILNQIENLGESIYQDEVQLFVGDARINFDRYVLLTPLFISEYTPTEISYQFSLSDTQRLSKKSLFSDPYKSLLVGNYGRGETTTLEVVSTEGSVLVYHDNSWGDAKNTNAGYLSVKGLNKSGAEVTEVIRYTGVNAEKTVFTGVKRSVFGTDKVDLTANDSSGASNEIELTEFVYIDLPQPTMALALLTGDYGIVGKSLPERWHSNLSASLINSASFLNVGADLYEQRVEFRGLESEEAKNFISKQVLSPYGTFMRIDQQGQFEMSRYGYVNQNSAADVYLNYSNLISVSPPKRNTKAIKNFFQINWEWRVDGQYFSRKDFYVDGNSQTKFKYESPIEEINLYGLRNSDKTSKPTLDFVVSSMLKRYSNPSVTRTAKAKLSDVIALQVGDLVSLTADNEPDFRTLGSYVETFEVQSINYDFFSNTATLNLFASEGVPSDFNVSYGDNALNVNTSSWTDLSTTSFGVVEDGVFKFNNNVIISSGKYRFDGDVLFRPNTIVRGAGSVYIDSTGNITLEDNFKLDMKGQGGSGSAGKLFGGEAYGADGIYVQDRPFGPDRLWNRFNGGYASKKCINVSDNYPYVVRVEDGGVIDQIIPSSLTGNGGPAGGNNDLDGLGGEVGNSAGAPAANGGGGVFFSCKGFQAASSAVIDVSGNDSNINGSTYVNTSYKDKTYKQLFHTASSGFGWPGVCIVALKDLGSPKPFLEDVVIAKTGKFIENQRQPSEALPEEIPYRRKDVNNGSGDYYKRKAYRTDYYPSNSRCSLSASDKDYATSSNKAAIHVMNFVVAGDHIPEIGVDPVDSAPAPVISYVERINIPRTTQGDKVTYELTAQEENETKYVKFEARVNGGEWNPVNHVLSFESVAEFTANGDDIQIRATAYSFDYKAGGETIIDIKLPIVNKDTNTSDGGLIDPPTDITLPNIKKLELVNRLDNDENWNKWKSPDAEFKWAKLSKTLSGSIVQLSASVDLHLEGYKVRIKRIDGSILREEIIKDTFYTYSFEKNKKDTDGSPVREFYFEVQAIATTGYVSEFTGIEVSNPAPSVVTNVIATQVADGVFITYTPPSDVDFVGIKVRDELYTGSSITIDPMVERSEVLSIVSVDQFGDGASTTKLIENPEPSAPSGVFTEVGFFSAKISFIPAVDFDFIGTEYRYREIGGSYNEPVLKYSNEITIEGLDSSTQYEIELTSVDKLGSGGSTSVIFETSNLTTDNVSGLGPWSTIDDADLSFINDHIDDSAVVFGKVATGTLAATEALQAGTINNGVLISGGGWIQSTNSGYVMTLGAHNIDGTNYILSASDGLSLPIWVKPNGSSKFGALSIDAFGSITSNQFNISGVTGDAFFSGELSAATGTFSGELSAATGTFSGELSAATGTFGDEPSGEYIKFSGGQLIFGENATIGDNTDRTVTVGVGGDYLTINDALVALSKVVPAYKSGGFTAIVQILSGESISGFTVSGIDLSWITITSIDSSVTLTSSILYTDGARGPVIGCSLTGGNVQIISDNASRIEFADGSDINFSTNSQASLLVDNSSSCNLRGTHTIDNNGLSGSISVQVRDGSELLGRTLNVEGGNGITGLRVTSGSRVVLNDFNLDQNGFTRGIFASGSEIRLGSYTAPFAFRCATLTQGSVLNVSGDTYIGSYSTRGIEIETGSSYTSNTVSGGFGTSTDVFIEHGTAFIGAQSGIGTAAGSNLTFGAFSSSGFIIRT